MERGEHAISFPYSRAELLAAVNELYRMSFFAYPERIYPRRSIFLRDDGTVGTQLLRMSDATTTTARFALPAYEKCVEYKGEGPRELEDLVQKLFADAARQAPPTEKAR